MTQEIMFADMLNHYSLKITELSDVLADAVSKLNMCVVLTEESWKSPSVVKFNDRIIELQKQIKEMDSALGEMTMIFSAIKNAELEAQTEQLAQNAVSDQE